MQDVNERTYRTSDFPLASFLFASGVSLQDIIDSPNNSQRKVFVFDYPPGKLLSEFQSGKAVVNVLAFANAQSHLKTLLRMTGR